MIEVAGEEVVGIFDDDEAIFTGKSRDEFFNFGASAEFVVGAVNEEFGLGAIGEKPEIGAVHRNAEADEFVDARIAAADAQANQTAKTETNKKQWRVREFGGEKIQGGLHVTLFADAFVVSAGA